MNLEGAAIPVVDLAAVLNLGCLTPGIYWNVVLLRRDVPPVAVLVERAERIVHIDAAEIRQLCPSESLNGCVVGAFSEGGQDISLLDLDRVLLERERMVMNAFRERAQRRLDDLEKVQP